MIIFCGTLSNKSKSYIIKRAKFISFIGLTFASLILLVPMILLTIKNIIYIIALIFVIFLPVLAFLPIKGKSLQKIVPTKIIIEKETITSEGVSFNYHRQISTIKKIVDFGEYYHIFFNFSNKCENFICQKDLIINGTIEEFEQMFKDKIVKKIN